MRAGLGLGIGLRDALTTAVRTLTTDIGDLCDLIIYNSHFVRFSVY